MDFAYFMDKIGLCPEGVSVFHDLNQRTDKGTLDRAYQAYDAGDEAFQSFLASFAAEKGVSPEEANLYLYIRMLDRTYDFYQAKGISDDVFYATMKTFAWACDSCYEKDGYYGIRQVTYRAWYRRHLDGTLYRLGRLEFDIFSSIYEFDLDGHHINKGDT